MTNGPRDLGVDFTYSFPVMKVVPPVYTRGRSRSRGSLDDPWNLSRRDTLFSDVSRVTGGPPGVSPVTGGDAHSKIWISYKTLESLLLLRVSVDVSFSLFFFYSKRIKNFYSSNFLYL